MVEKTMERFGRVDILVNNAGVAPEPALISELEETVWDKTMAVNAKGVFLCCKRVAPEMAQRREGSIINISSRMGKVGLAKGGAYCASKFAVVAITQVLALEMAPYGVRVNAVCPGWVATNMNVATVGEKESEKWGVSLEEARQRLVDQLIPLKRMATLDELSNVVAFLASSESSYMTGQSINVTGGRWMH